MKNPIKGIGKSLFIKIKRHPISTYIYKLVFFCLGLLPMKKNLIIFESFLGKQYSCNPRAIYEYMKVNHPEYVMYWSVDKKYLQNFQEKTY